MIAFNAALWSLVFYLPLINGSPLYRRNNQPDLKCLNETIHGSLHRTVPLAAACYPNNSSFTLEYDCPTVQANYTVSDFRASVYGAAQYTNWESDGSETCTLPMGNATSCQLGRLSEYYVDARCADDVAAAMTFASQNSIKISIKNTGHDYLGRSTGKDTLAIWTHHMNDTKVMPNYTLASCEANNELAKEAIAAVKVGAGTSAVQAYLNADAAGYQALGGAYGSVGIAGGFTQGGGHGPMQPKYGLAVDQVLEFEVVLSNGTIVTANACSEPDLFWALRGGGGGTYGVVTSMTSRIYPTLPLNFAMVKVEVLSEDDNATRAAMKDLVTGLGQSQPSLSAAGIAGYNFVYPNAFLTAQITANEDQDIVKKTFGPFVEALSNDTRYNVSQAQFQSFPNWAAFSPVVEQLGAQTPVGLGKRLASRFIPKKFFANDTCLSQAVDAIFDGFDTYLSTNPSTPEAPLNVQMWSTGPANHPDGSQVGANPAWRDEQWEVIYVGSFNESDPASVKDSVTNGIHQAADHLRAITPGGGTYMNEADVLEEDWQQAFFGSNYDRLLQVKQRYDPDGLLSCWKCVGWQGDK